MDIYRATVGKEFEIPLKFGVITGLTLGTLDTVFAADGISILSFAADLGAILTEVNAITAPGLYLLKFTPRRAGAMYVQLVEGAEDRTFVVASELSVPPMVADPALEGDHVITVQVGASLIQGATVRIFNTSGVLIARGLTDAAGQVSFPLEAGAYEARISKDGLDFSAVNPLPLTVVPNNNTTPVLTEILPGSAAIGATILLRGQFFHLTASEVLFGTATPVPAASVSPDLRAALVVVPAGLTDTALAVRVRKPDPDNPGSYLLSNVVTLVRLP